ncbi:conserved domain protein [Paraprevotella xylaniphila YIT 11841]|uniref:Conserved domain protein n=1 Tax=Paraprevotella xylaniphila YIT 11841 TaxID=762982 RepID=F3QQC9_9BACT|nr:conserved domain protein [Paraprevotella xylaniphila YIT 11841]
MTGAQILLARSFHHIIGAAFTIKGTLFKRRPLFFAHTIFGFDTLTKKKKSWRSRNICATFIAHVLLCSINISDEYHPSKHFFKRL